MLNKRYSFLIKPFEGFTKKPFIVNPTLPPVRQEPDHSFVTITSYNKEFIDIQKTTNLLDCEKCRDPDRKLWINIDGIRKEDIETVGSLFDVHALITEDILSIGQRPKMDEMNNIVYALLNMMYFNEKEQAIDSEQISIILGKNFVISFQEDPGRDLFNPIREKLMLGGSRVRNYHSDYLFYSLIDIIVDNYFVIMERMGEQIEYLEEEIIQNANTVTLARINHLRKEMIFLKRHIAPVRELVNGILRSESDLINERTEKYFKDIYDHIVQAAELSESYRDMMLNLHDLYLSELNLKMNEVMKVMAIVTCLLAPATVIGGIFGMNFHRMPWLQDPSGFYLAVGLMLLIPVGMLWWFKQRDWF